MIRLVDVLATGVLNNGQLVANGTVRFLEKESTTLKTAFKDFDLTEPHPNPATLDSSGKLVAYLDGRTKLEISDSSGNFLYSIDNVGTEDSQVTEAAANVLAGDGLLSVANEISVNVDGSSLEVADDLVKVKDLGVLTSYIADGAITNAKLAAVNSSLSSSSSTFDNNSAGWVAVTNLSVSITTVGRPVQLRLIAADSTQFCYVQWLSSSSNAGFKFTRGGSDIALYEMTSFSGPPSSLEHTDVPAAGTYTYAVQVRPSSSSCRIYNCKLEAVEWN